MVDLNNKNVGEITMAKNVTTGVSFTPQHGKKYEVHFGEITYQNTEGFVSANILIDGDDWIDIDTGSLLDRELRTLVVQAFIEL